MGTRAAGGCFHSFSVFYKTLKSVSITHRNTEYMFSISFRKHRNGKEEKQLVNFDLQKCKFSLLAPSSRQQFVLVLCFHRVIKYER